jgi:hypothetical protein
VDLIGFGGGSSFFSGLEVAFCFCSCGGRFGVADFKEVDGVDTFLDGSLFEEPASRRGLLLDCACVDCVRGLEV